MVFSSIVFLCGFMPAVFLLYFLCPARFRNPVLLAASLLFYAWGEPVYIFVMLFSTVFDYCNGRAIARLKDAARPRAAKAVLAASVVGNLTILFVFKYAGFFIDLANSMGAGAIPAFKAALPIGISFYTFQTMSYTIDVYRGRVEAQKNFISFATYVCMFPQLVAGPIVRYEHVADDLDKRRISSQDVALGLWRFAVGLGKKAIFANQAGEIWNDISTAPSSEMSMSLAWLGAIAYTFQIYFDFSGYSDMAIGMGQMLGFSFPENFTHPYQSKSITEFWRRWHISLGSWLKEYVYIPLGGNRRGIFKQVFNMFAVWTLTGFWHGAQWNFVIWGIYYFVLLLLEKWFLLEKLKKAPSAARHAYALFFIALGWVIFACTDIDRLGSYLAAMAGWGVPFMNGASAYKWHTSLFLLIILALASTEYPKAFLFKLEAAFAARHPAIDRFYGEAMHFWIVSIFTIFVLFASLSFIISGGYNPFLYFRF